MRLLSRQKIVLKMVADFETTTDVEDCRVWAWGICNIENLDFKYGNDIESFFDEISKYTKLKLWFHNLKFDGEFIFNYLFNAGYKHTEEKKLKTKEFSTLISDMGQFYSIKINYDGSIIEIFDSLKVLPFTVEQIGKSFSITEQKLEIDYTEKREKGHILTHKEVEYLKHDCIIVAKALKILHNQDMQKMTTGANALYNFKKTIGAKQFDYWFPPPYYDSDIRKAYKGGFTYLNPKFANKTIGKGIVLDVNSLYPSVMYYNPLPYGEGIYFDGKYEYDPLYNVYIQKIRCQFKIKENKIPTIQIKNNLSFIPTQYLTSTDGEQVCLSLSSVDEDLFFEHYDVFDLEYIDGWKFKSAKGIFKDYIEYWNGQKVKATIEGNKPMRQIAKLMLNSLYGKFASRTQIASKVPYMQEGIIKYRTTELKDKAPVYVPVGIFITAWARYKTITSAQKVYDRFIYADTDSLHLVGDDIPPELEISDTELGKWKHESTFSKAKFLRQKSYIEVIDNKLNITCAGMPDRCYDNVTFDNFTLGASYAGKLAPKHVPGGIVLTDTPFTIKC